MCIRTSMEKESRNDTLAYRMSMMGRGDIRRIETRKGPTERVYVRWASKEGVIL